MDEGAEKGAVAVAFTYLMSCPVIEVVSSLPRKTKGVVVAGQLVQTYVAAAVFPNISTFTASTGMASARIGQSARRSARRGSLARVEEFTCRLAPSTDPPKGAEVSMAGTQWEAGGS